MKKRPNILLITDDQHRFDFYEGGVVDVLKTPAWNRLRMEGTSFLHSYSNCPICMPTRMTWLYGLYASQVADRLLANAHDWPENLPSMAQVLQKQGYRTSLVGKLHSLAGLYKRSLFDEKEKTEQRGFDDVLEVSGGTLALWYDCAWTEYLRGKGLLEKYQSSLIDREGQFGQLKETYTPGILKTEDTLDHFVGLNAVNWLKGNAGNSPFFLHVSFCGPHFPIDPPAEYFERFNPEDMPPPVGVEDETAIRQWQQRRAAYCAKIALIDDQIGTILDLLDKDGLSENTLVIYTSDHGDRMGSMGQTNKSSAHDSSSRVSTIVRLPGKVPGGVVSEAMIEAVDLPCSILEAAGCDSPEEFLPNTPGRSWWDHIIGKSTSHREWVFSECGSPEKRWQMCREKDWKYILWSDGKEELYDMQEDPNEICNLAETENNKKRLSKMRKRLLLSTIKVGAANQQNSLPASDLWWEKEK